MTSMTIEQVHDIPVAKSVETCQQGACLPSEEEIWGNEKIILKQEILLAKNEAFEYKERFDALVQATRILTRLMLTHPREDDFRLIQIGRPEKNEEEEAAQNDQKNLHQQLEDFQCDLRLEDTGFNALFNACKMTRENLRLTSIEADEAIEDIRSVQAASVVSDSKQQKVEDALCKLWVENTKLKEEVDKKAKERKKLVKKVREYVEDMSQRQEEQVEKAYAMGVHEHALISFDQSDMISHIEFNSDDDTLSCSASSMAESHSNLVTGEGLATVELAVKRQVSRLKESINNRFTLKRQKRPIYHLTFSDRNIGLMLCDAPVNNPRPLITFPEEKEAFADVNTPPSNKGFFVCGFEAGNKKRPTLGARLVAVDGWSLEEGQWTLKEVCEFIRSKEDEPISLSFRNDLLTKEQMKRFRRLGMPALTPTTKGNSSCQ